MHFAKAIQHLEPILGASQGKDLSPKERETLYAAAYGLYEVGDYEKASGLFTKLAMHDPYELRFWKGLASSYQMAKKYKEALHAWAIASLLSGHNPMTHFHAAECYLSLGEIEESKKALQCAELHLKEEDRLFQKVETLKMRLSDGTTC